MVQGGQHSNLLHIHRVTHTFTRELPCITTVFVYGSSGAEGYLTSLLLRKE